ncbi:MAG: hypothetical protein NC251_10475 [Lachnoclostridium sp.]|nr:hypothetical protein [Lachnospira sp.]MCM1248843.1 hypothetical protein [Lachnoclostridium sp.]MCM1535304.1 hypothetical protein [Clostridium sp.]
MERDVSVEAFQALASECQSIVSQVRIPILTNNKDVQKYVKEFGLEDPQKLARFFVEGFCASFENIQSAINGSQRRELEAVLGEVRGTKDAIITGINNPEYKQEYLIPAHSTILIACGKLEEWLRDYINEIEAIDQKSKWQFFLGAKGSLSKIDTNIFCAKKAVEALDITIRLQAIVMMQLNQKSTMVIKDHITSVKSIFTDERCDLLNAYDKDKQNGYWWKILSKMEAWDNIGNVLDRYCEIQQQNQSEIGCTKHKEGFFKRWKKRIGNNH